MTFEEITAILGPVDETLVAEISQTGATPEELVEAWAWLNADEALINEGRPHPSGRVGKLVEILEPNPTRTFDALRAGPSSRLSGSRPPLDTMLADRALAMETGPFPTLSCLALANFLCNLKASEQFHIARRSTH